MGTTKDIIREDNLKLRLLQEKGPALHQKLIHTIKKGRTQLGLILAFVYLLVNRLQWFKHPTNDLITDIRMYD